jgi:hypothetical protein
MIMLIFAHNELYSQESSPSILFSTYYGDIGADDADVVAVDLDGNIYLGCHSNSTNLSGADKQEYNLSGGIDAFVIKLNNKGSEVSYLTQLGGVEWDAVQGLVSDAEGNIYAVGTTYSAGFPVNGNTFQPNFGGESDAFVVKLNPEGEVVWSTFLGGNKNEDGRDIVIDKQGYIHIVGLTESGNFPITDGALQSKLAGGTDAFITTLDSNGEMITSTYLGGTDDDVGFSIALDSNGQLYAAGTTNAINFPMKNAIQDENQGGNDIFLTVIDKTKTGINFSSYLGGKGKDQLYSLCLDSLGNTFIMGVTSSSDYPTTKNAFQSDFGGVKDVFVTKLDLKKGEVTYSTYLGGDKEDNPRNLVVNEKGNAYIVGNTASNNFPTKKLQETQISGSHDAFLSMLDPSGSTLHYSFLFGGDGRDVYEGIAIGVRGSLTISGASNSTNFPLVNPLQSKFHGGRFDMIVTRLLLD